MKKNQNSKIEDFEIWAEEKVATIKDHFEPKLLQCTTGWHKHG